MVITKISLFSQMPLVENTKYWCYLLRWTIKEEQLDGNRGEVSILEYVDVMVPSRHCGRSIL
jgi:hypothetical protein